MLTILTVLQASQALPKEPAEHEANISKIRVRKPTGDFLERRFFTRDTLQVRANFQLYIRYNLIIFLRRIC